MCILSKKEKIQVNTQIYHMIVNKEDDLICFHYFKIKCEVVLLMT